jgi:hypothetical protein
VKILVVLDQSDYLEKIQTEAETDNPAFCIERVKIYMDYCDVYVDSSVQKFRT